MYFLLLSWLSHFFIVEGYILKLIFCCRLYFFYCRNFFLLKLNFSLHFFSKVFFVGGDVEQFYFYCYRCSGSGLEILRLPRRLAGKRMENIVGSLVSRFFFRTTDWIIYFVLLVSYHVF